MNFFVLRPRERHITFLMVCPLLPCDKMFISSRWKICIGVVSLAALAAIVVPVALHFTKGDGSCTFPLQEYFFRMQELFSGQLAVHEFFCMIFFFCTSPSVPYYHAIKSLSLPGRRFVKGYWLCLFSAR